MASTFSSRVEVLSAEIAEFYGVSFSAVADAIRKALDGNNEDLQPYAIHFPQDVDPTLEEIREQFEKMMDA